MFISAHPARGRLYFLSAPTVGNTLCWRTSVCVIMLVDSLGSFSTGNNGCFVWYDWVSLSVTYYQVIDLVSYKFVILYFISPSVYLVLYSPLPRIPHNEHLYSSLLFIIFIIMSTCLVKRQFWLYFIVFLCIFSAALCVLMNEWMNE